MKMLIPVLRNVPLKYHGPDEPMYSTDGFHYYYPGEEPVFDLVEAGRPKMNTAEEVIELVAEWAKAVATSQDEADARLAAIWDLCSEYLDRDVEEVDDDYELDA